MNMNRRKFVTGVAVTTAFAAFRQELWPGLLSAEVPSAMLANDPNRPQFHLLPARNWMNDPNGPIYYQGQYHMFFQYNPLAAVWGDMSWNHSVSPDMIHWTHLPLAFTPTPGSADSFGCFSGSAIRVGERVYQVYTGTKEGPKELATIRDSEDKIQESQCLAYSDDPKLIKWTKLPHPIIPLPPSGMQVTGFRDPSAWKQGEWYYMTVGSGVANVGGCVLLYRSKNVEDARRWEYLHELTSGEWNGKKTSNPCDDGEMWECPDFFELDGGHVLIYSTLGKVFWQSGELDAAAMKFHPKKSGELDLGAFYAPKTQLDAHGRRILWGWIQERRSEDAMRAAGWSGMMSLPRVLKLDKDGTLRITTLPQLDELRDGSLAAKETGDGLRLVLPHASGEVLCTGAQGSAMELTMSDGAKELLRVSYSPEKHSMIADGKEIVLETGDVPKLHAFVDASVIELVLG
jgi:beta-fructofuranosidase